MRLKRFICLGISALSVGCDRPEKPLPVLVIDTSSGFIVERWPAPDLVYDVAIDPVTGRVWAAAEARFAWEIWELSRDSRPTLHQTVSIPDDGDGIDRPIHRSMYMDIGSLALDTVGRRGAFTSPRSEQLILLDIDSGEIVRRLLSDDWEHSVDFDEDGGIGYATTGEVVYAFSSATGDPVGIDLCDSWGTTNSWTIAIDFSESTGKVYATLGNDSEVCEYDPVLGTFSILPLLCDEPPDSRCFYNFAIASNHAGNRLYVADFFGLDTVAGFSPIEFLALGTGGNLTQTSIMDGRGPHGFEISPDDSTLYVTEYTCNRIGVFDARSGEHRYDIPTDGETLGMDLSADGSRLFVTQADPDGPLGGGTAYFTETNVFDACPPLKLNTALAGIP